MPFLDSDIIISCDSAEDCAKIASGLTKSYPSVPVTTARHKDQGWVVIFADNAHCENMDSYFAAFAAGYQARLLEERGERCTR